MKHKLLRLQAILLAIALLLPLAACGKKYEPVSLCIPYESLPTVARVPWDLAIHEGYLYIGAGDYGRNISPRVAMRLCLADNTVEPCGEINDEQINRFVFLDGSLVIPGIDPHDVEWTTGCYYVLKENGFVTVSTITRGVHTFDMISHNGALFAALGVDLARQPLAVSYDGGATFEAMPIEYNGLAVLPEDLDDNRIYDFILFDGALYLLYLHNLFVYNEEEGCFSYVADWTGLYTLADETYVPILAKAEFAEQYFFTTEYLYVCKKENGSVSKPQALSLKGVDAVTDLYLYGDTLYLLGNKKTAVGYQSTVYATQDGESFNKLFSFHHALPAFSFACDEDTFYFGMGKINSANSSNGEIIKIAY